MTDGRTHRVGHRRHLWFLRAFVQLPLSARERLRRGCASPPSAKARVRHRTCHFALSSAFWRFALNPFPLLPLAGNSVLQTDFHPALKLQSRMSPALHCQSGTSAHAKCRAGSQPIQSYSIEHAECNGMCFACSERDHTAATLGPCPVHCACVSTTMRVHTCSRSYVVRWRAAIGRTASNCWTSAWQGDGFER